MEAYTIANLPALYPGLSVTVRVADKDNPATGSLVTIYELDETTPLPNPFTADINGRFEFKPGSTAEVDVQLGGTGSATDLVWNGGNAYHIYGIATVDISTLNTAVSDAAASAAAASADAAALAVQGALITEAEFNTLAAANRDKFAGSGFVEWGNSRNLYSKINEGLFTYNSVVTFDPSKLLLGHTDSANNSPSDVSKTGESVVNVNGVLGSLDGINSSGIFGARILLPPASAIAALTERQDLVFLETFHEDVALKDIVYPNGCIQSLLATDPATGLTTVNGAFTGFETYSLFGNWQASSALIGRGLVWSTMTDANKKLFVADPENNCYLSPTGAVIQVRQRIRVIEGLGAEWVSGNIGINPQTAIYAGYGDTTKYLNAKGADTSITADLSVYDFKRAFTAIPGFGATLVTGDEGVFGLAPTYYSTIAYTGLCFAIPIALVSRRNQGAFHPVFNPNGTARFWDAATQTTSVDWYSTFSQIPTSTADCFIEGGAGSGAFYRADFGSIAGTAPIGRPDGKFYDAIYESDVLDLRNSAHKQDLTRTLEREFNKLVAGETRGWEKGSKIVLEEVITEVRTTLTATAMTATVSNFETGDFVIATDDSTGALVIAGYVYTNGTDAIFFSLTLATAIENAGTSLGETFSRVNGQVYKLHKISPVLVPHKTLLWCDTIGDPASYSANMKQYGFMGNALLVDEYGVSITPAGQILPKFSRKVKSSPTLSLRSADNGATWSDITAGWAPDWNSAANRYDTVLLSTGYIYMFFYETEASPFELAVNAEVLKLSDAFALNHNTQANLLSDLIGKVATGTTGYATRFDLDGFTLDTINKLRTEPAYTPSHSAATAHLDTTSPAGKLAPKLTRKNGKLLLQATYKEMKYDVTWGDDSKFNIVDNESTTIDDNASTVLIGQKRLELPYFIGDGE